MNILLVGKYPPLQGGVSAKTFWLYRALMAQGFRFRVVTCQDLIYSQSEEYDIPEWVFNVNRRKIPWHIPETELLPDRLLNQALHITETFTPDLIETNYLWPFCQVAINLACILKKPLLIRHAGSDILKFKDDPEFFKIILRYIDFANGIVTNQTAMEFLKKVATFPERITCLDRYIPDPSFFFPLIKSEKKFDLLMVGKVNYYWQLKGLDLMMNFIKKEGLRTLFIVNGKGMNQFSERLSDYNIEAFVKVCSFVSPEQMPDIYRSASCVWCWEEADVLDDFSNVVWEALYSGLPIIINAANQKKIQTEKKLQRVKTLLRPFTVSELENFNCSNEFFVGGGDGEEINGEKEDYFCQYIGANAQFYERVAAQKIL
jgi:glycosyltransferase involved in cell wall biosynthesis